MRQHLRAAPGDPDGWRGLGSIAWTRRDFRTALRWFRRALALEPWSPVHWSTVGLALRDLAQLDAASRTFSVATTIDPGYAPAWNEWGNVHVDAGRPAAALPLYARTLELDASRAVYHHNRGVALRLCGDQGRACESFRAALRLDPGYQWSIVELQRIGVEPAD